MAKEKDKKMGGEKRFQVTAHGVTEGSAACRHRPHTISEGWISAPEECVLAGCFADGKRFHVGDVVKG